MKKSIFCFIFTLLMANFVAAQEREPEYGDYSQEYYDCLNNSSANVQDPSEKCTVEEYRRINTKINTLLNKIKVLPAVAQYAGDKEKSLISNIKNFQNYMETYCKIKVSVSENNISYKQCLLEQINMIYVDLYKLHQLSEKK